MKKIIWLLFSLVPISLIIYIIRFWGRGVSNDPDMWHGFIALLIQAIVAFMALLIAMHSANFQKELTDQANTFQKKLAITLRKNDLYAKFKSDVEYLEGVESISFAYSAICADGSHEGYAIRTLQKLISTTKEISRYTFLFEHEQIEGFKELITYIEGYIIELENPLFPDNGTGEKHTPEGLQNLINRIDDFFI